MASSSVKEKLRKKPLGKSSSFGAVRNPIADEIKDLDEARLSFRDYPIIPFHEDGDATLYFWDLLKKLSPTIGGIINKIGDFLLAGEMEVIKKKRPGFAHHTDDEVEVSKEDYHRFIDFVNSFISGRDLMKSAWRMYKNLIQTGNIMVEVSWGLVAGEKFMKIVVHDSETCRYFASMPGDDKIMFISPLWTSAYLAKNIPRIVPVFPAKSTSEDGVTRTLIHNFNHEPGHPWYGLPYWISCMYDGYMEVQRGEYGTKGYANDFTGKIMIETVDDVEDEEEEYENGLSENELSFKEAIEEVFTNKGDGQGTVLHRTRGVNSEKAFIHEFKPNTNEDFHRYMSEVNERQIFKAFGWHPMLSVSTPGKLGQSAEYREILRAAFNTTIKRLDKQIMDVIDQILDLAAEFLGPAEQKLTEEFGLGLVNLFQEMMEEDPTEETEESEEPQEDDNPEPEPEE